jgi:ABC-type transport system involved in multi-copper enzyme maturation permease subunit
MLIGPIFTRELATAVFRQRFYAVPALYLTGMLLLLIASWLLFTGTQDVHTVGDMARFGMTIFPILAILQLALATFFSAILAAGSVAQEKDRRTLILLLLTRLSNSELVLGRLFASLLPIIMCWVASVPFFILLRGFGGISLNQVLLSLGVSLVTIFTAGSLGSLMALWREKTFLALALTLLVLCSWLGFWAVIDGGSLGERWQGFSVSSWAAMFSPFHAMRETFHPFPLSNEPALFGLVPLLGFFVTMPAIGIVLNLIAIIALRIWNPSREAPPKYESELTPSQAQALQTSQPADSAAKAAEPNIHAVAGRARPVWDNPILWREIRTWPYGKRILLVKVIYLLLFALAALSVWSYVKNGVATRDTLAGIMAPLGVLSLILLNTLAVNSITNERDIGALHLLLVTDLTPKEFIYGKLAGVLYSAKEMVLTPILMIIGLRIAGVLATEFAIYLALGLLVMQVFATMLGIHAGMSYDNSRSAIAVSLGTVFFLLVGVGACMRIMIAFSNTSLSIQLVAFSTMILCGGLILFAILGVRNPSTALMLASFVCPIATYVAIMNFLSGDTFNVFFVMTLGYGFFSIAMLVPAIAEFDVATGRTTE